MTSCISYEYAKYPALQYTLFYVEKHETTTDKKLCFMWSQVPDCLGNVDQYDNELNDVSDAKRRHDHTHEWLLCVNYAALQCTLKDLHLLLNEHYKKTDKIKLITKINNRATASQNK